VYDPINARSETKKAQDIVRSHYHYFLAHPEEMPELYVSSLPEDPVERRVADFIASMTDRFAVELYQKLHIPAVLAP
jgi:dGTPase